MYYLGKMKYLTLHIELIRKRNKYKLDCMFNSTLSPRCYPQGYAGFYVPWRCFYG